VEKSLRPVLQQRVLQQEALPALLRQELLPVQMQA